MKKKYGIISLLIFILVVASGLVGSWLGQKQALEIRLVEDRIISAGKTAKGPDQEVEAGPREKSQLDLVVVGDIMFHLPQLKGAKNQEGYDFKNSFKYVEDIIDQGDLSLANLETTLGEPPYFGYPNFRSPREVARDLDLVGFDILNLNNNHSLDQGLDGLLSTLDSVKGVGLDFIGANARDLDRFLIKEVNGIRLGFLSYSYGYNGMEARLGPGQLGQYINIIDPEKIQEDIESLKKITDQLIVYIHWGQEYKTSPSDSQIDLGQSMLDWGADIVLGSHPHVVQKAVLNQDQKLIAYSLGNFLSNQSQDSSGSSYVKDGLILGLRLEKDPELGQTKLVKLDYIPTWVYKYSSQGRIHHEIIPIERALKGEIQVYRQATIENELKNSYNRTMDIINKS